MSQAYSDQAERERRLSHLMRCAQDGDGASYARLLNESAVLLRRHVARTFRYLSPQDVEDVVQDILLSLHTVRATYDRGRPFLPWLMAIARNRVADAARRSVRRNANEVAVAELPETFAPDGANIMEAPYGDPQALHQALRGLPPGQRQAVELLKLREMSLKEAAASTGMSVAALKVAVHRGMAALRRSLMAKTGL